MIICKICNAELNNNIALGLHVKHHNINSKEYYDRYLKKPNEGICPVCKKETKWQSLDRGYLKHCSCKCTQNDKNVIQKRENHFIEKYGVKNPYQSEEIKEKIKQTHLQGTGYEYNLQNPETIKRAKQTKLEKYGDVNYNNIEKAKQTCIKKYNVDSFSKTNEFKEMLLEKVDFYEIAKKGKITHSKKINQMKEAGYITIQEAFIKYGQSWYKNNIVPILYKNHTGFISSENEKKIEEYYINNNGHSSQEENKLLDILHKYYNDNIIHGENKVIAPLELDFFLPKLNIAIEYNGMYWHSTKFKENDYHYNKSIQCFNKGIRLIHFYEFEKWEYIEDFIKNMINKTEIITNDFNKFSPLQLSKDKVVFSGPQLISTNIYGSGTFSVL